MTIKETVTGKEKAVKLLLEELRAHLNAQRQSFDKNPQTWEYISTLGITETRLKELLDFLRTPV